MTTVASNAYNFSESITAGVDVRTGMYSFSVNLGEFFSHKNTGPTFNLALNYNAAQNQDMGFGRGWALSLSSFQNDTLSLSTGQSFKIEWNEEEQEYDVPYRKLRDIRVFYLDDTEEVQVVYKDGRKDFISWSGGNLTKMVSSQGLEIHFDYYSFNNNLCLARIHDGEREITIDWWTDDWQTVVKHSMAGTLYQELLFDKLGGGAGIKRLSSITFPDSSQSTHIDYRYVASCDYDLITKVTQPSGMVEDMIYLDAGHTLPSGAPITKVPYVTSRVVKPGVNQPDKAVAYKYSDKNYLGFASDAGYVPGEDTLFKAQGDYQYSCTETINGERTVERVYNKYHLLESVKYLDHGTLYLEEDNVYFANLNTGIEAQPAAYSLVKEEAHTYYHGNDSATFKTIYDYDDFGNQTYIKRPDNTVIQRTFYPAAGEAEKCPAEPNGMIALLKRETIAPASNSSGESPRHTDMTYEKVPTLDSSSDYFVVVSSVADNNESTVYTYYRDKSARYQYGRTQTEATTVAGSTETTTYTYDFADDGLTTTVNVLTHDGIDTVESETSSYLDGQTLENVDLDGIKTVNSYDVIGRLKSVSVAPDTDYVASTSYLYDVGNGANVLTTTDAKGNQLLRHFNNAGNEIRREQSDDEGSLRTISELFYDADGLLVTKIETDWLDGVALVLTTTYEHDVHGQVSKVTHPDGRVELIDQNIPKLTTVYETQGLMKVITIYNPAGLKVSKETLDLSTNSSRLARTLYRYDGFWNLLGTTDTGNHETSYDYDSNDRVIAVQKVIDGKTVIQSIDYASFSTEALPTQISIDGTSLGLRQYDGLSRVIHEQAAGASTGFSYTGASSLPSSQTAPGGETLTYDNNLYLQMPASRDVTGQPGLSGAFSYDPITGGLTGDSKQDAQRTSVHSRLGFLESETVQLGDGVSRTSLYGHSLKGKLLLREDFFGNETSYGYDSLGRLHTVSSTQSDVPVTTTISYDDYSRPTLYVSTQGEDQLSITLEFNAVGLESNRTVLFNGVTLFTLAQTFNADLQVETRVYTAGVDVTTETMTYDDLHRLELYVCAGPNAPRDTYGNVISEQRYGYDVYYNVIHTETLFTDSSSNTATLKYESNNPLRLQKILNNHADYPSEIIFSHDEAGNLLTDERGRSYLYNALGQMVSVSEGQRELSRYQYNATGQVVSQTQDSSQIFLHYHGYQLANESSGSDHTSYQLVGGTASRMVDVGGAGQHQFLIPNAQGSILSTLTESESLGDRVQEDYQYTPYGERTPAATSPTSPLAQNTLGFNGERQDPVTELYHLGNGYRAYNPALMAFHSSDSMSPFGPSDSMTPFGKGGVNAYAYCLGDPMNLKDPSGHFGLLSLLIGAIVGAVIGAAISTVSEGIKSLVTGEKFDGRQVAIGAALGFISGGFGVAAQGAKTSVQAGLAIADVVVTGSADFGLSVATGNSLKDAGISAGIGAIVGFASFGAGVGVGKVSKSLSRGKSAGRNKGMVRKGATKARQRKSQKKSLGKKASKFLAKGLGDEKRVRAVLFEEMATGMTEEAVVSSLTETVGNSGSDESPERQHEIDGSASYLSRSYPHRGPAEASGRKVMEPDFVKQTTRDVSVARQLVSQQVIDELAD